MTDAFSPRLSGPSNQASISKPTVTQSQPSVGQIVAGSLIDVADLAIRAKQATDQQTAQTQDTSDFAQAVTDRNNQLNQRDEALALQNDVFTLTADVEKARADGVISEDEAGLINTFNTKFQKLKSAEVQGMLDPSKFNIQSRKLLNESIAQNPRIAKDLVSVFNKGTGGGISPTTGAVQAQQLAFNQRMTTKYGLGFSQEDVIKEASVQRELTAAKDMRTLGSIDVDNIASSTSISASAGIDEIMTPMSKLFTSQQALNQEQIDGALGQISILERNLKRSVEQDVFKAQKEGRILDDREVATMNTRIEERMDRERLWITDRSLQKMLAKRNATEAAAWKAGLGGKIDKISQIARLGGEGALTTLNATFASSSKTQDDAIRTLGGLDFTNVRETVVNAMERVTQESRVKGFEKLDAYVGLQAMRSGTVEEVVKQNTLANITSLVETPEDAAQALVTYNSDKEARSIQAGDTQTKAQFIGSVNGFESLIFGEMEAREAIVVFKGEVDGVLAGLEVRTPTTFARKGEDTGGTKPSPNLTRKLKNAMDLHRNPNYSGILQPTPEWLREVTERFKQEEKSTTDSQDTPE